MSDPFGITEGVKTLSGHTHNAFLSEGSVTLTSATTTRSSQTAIAVSGYIASNTTGITLASAGTSGTNANLPPYYALAYIMKT